MSERHLTTSQFGAVAAEAMDTLRAEAKERMKEGGGDRKSAAAKSGMPKSTYPIPPTPISEIKGPVREIAAKSAGGLRVCCRACGTGSESRPRRVRAGEARRAEQIVAGSGRRGARPVGGVGYAAVVNGLCLFAFRRGMGVCLGCLGNPGQ